MAEKNARPGDPNRIAREYLDSILLETRFIGSRGADTSFSLFGKDFQTPVMTAALSHLEKYARPGGMRMLAEGAAAAGAVLWTGMTEDDEIRAMAETGASIIEIIKPYKDRGLIRHRMDVAAALGHLAVGVDIDMVYDGAGNPRVFHGYELMELTEEEIAEFVSCTKLPFIIKGVLSRADAKAALRAGVSGMVVSNHGGTTEYAVPPLFALEKIVRTDFYKSNPVPLFTDGEIKTGTDVFKALAVGAAGVSIGRPLIEAIKENGAEGVRDYIIRATGELRKAMVSTGCGTLGDIKPEMIYFTGT